MKLFEMLLEINTIRIMDLSIIFLILVFKYLLNNSQIIIIIRILIYGVVINKFVC